MFNPNRNYLDYGGVIKPPFGYKLSKALAFTYSLDLDTLVSIPIALHFSQTLDLNIETSVVQLLDAITKTKNLIKVVYNKGQMSVRNTDHFLHSLFADSIVEYSPEPNTSFHPKCWMLRFTDSQRNSIYRVAVLSRNMTYDDCWDVFFSVQGKLTGKKQATANTKALADLISHVQNCTDLKDYDDFIEELQYVSWELENDFISIDDFNFQSSGFKGAAGFDMFNIEERYKKSLVISPFLTGSLVSQVADNCRSKPVFISRKTDIDAKLTEQMFKRVTFYTINDEVVLADNPETEKIEESFLETSPPDIHAKLYAFDDADEKTSWIYLGSANATHKGHNGNIELMVMLKSKTSHTGVDLIKQNLLDKNSYFMPYPNKEDCSAKEIEITRAEKELDQIKLNLIDAIVKATYVKNEKENYDLTLSISSLQIPAHISAFIRPIYVIPDLEAEVKPILKFHNLEEKQLTSFFQIRIKHNIVKDAAQCHFVLRSETIGIPDDFDKLIFKKIISDSSNFMRYLRFLLAEDYWDGVPELDSKKALKKFFGGEEPTIFYSDQPIYEMLLKAYSREHEKLDDIQKALDNLDGKEGMDYKIVPEEFHKLWKRIYRSNKKK